MANRSGNASVDLRGVLIGGGLAGIVAGIVMAAAAMFYAAENGSGFWFPVRSIAATWYGANALMGGAAVLIVGMITHLGNSAFWGVIFSALPPRRKTAPLALVGGLLWGVVIWATMSFAVMPWLNPTMYAGTVRMEGSWWFVFHLIYGGMLVVTPGFVRRVSAHWPAAPAAKPYRESRRVA